LAGFGDLSLVTKAYASAAVSTEASLRIVADASIATNLSSELVNRASADASIATGLSSELVNRASADASIATNLSTEKARIDAILIGASASADNFAEIVQLINSVDTTNDEAFAGYVLANNAALSAELVARASADASVMANLSSEISRAESSELSLASLLGTDLSTEVARAESAEASLDVAKLNLAGGDMVGDIDMGYNTIRNIHYVFVNTIGGADSTDIIVDNDMDFTSTRLPINLPAPINAGDATNKDYVDSAKSSLESGLSAEVSRAIEAEGSIFAEVVANLSSEVARATSVESTFSSNFNNTYSQHVVVNEAADGTRIVFTLAYDLRSGSELVYMNGLLLDAGDYTADMTAGKVSGFTFVSAPLTGDKVRAYGVYDATFVPEPVVDPEPSNSNTWTPPPAQG
jgi:hypothetical protein